MTPNFAKAVDPVFLHLIKLQNRIERKEFIHPQDEQDAFLNHLDRAELSLGKDQSWELAKYALVAWADELLIELPWDGRDWWLNNAVEVKLYGFRQCYTQFYERAREAGKLKNRDALEVFYVCVVLGFQGLYREPRDPNLIKNLDLPGSMEAWLDATSRAIQLGQHRAALARPGEEGEGAFPLEGQAQLLGTLLSAIILAALNAFMALLFFL